MCNISLDILRKSNPSRLREAGSILRDAFSLILFEARAGLPLKDLDSIVGKFLKKHGATATSILLKTPYQFSVSLNEEVTNGFPDDRVFREEDLVKIDMSIYHIGVFVDKARSFIIPPITGTKKYIISATEACLKAGIAVAKSQNTNLQIGSAIQETAKYYGVSPSNRFWGHGIGSNYHMEPVIPNIFTDKVPESVLFEGQSIAIEPVIFFGDKYKLSYNNNTLVANVINAHMEDTVIIHQGEAEVIT